MYKRQDWYGNNEYIVNWALNGAEIKNNKDPKTGRIRSHNYKMCIRDRYEA